MKLVTRVERISLLIVAVVLLLALAVPATRLFTAAAFKRIVPSGEKNVWCGQFDPAIPGPKSDAVLARENHKDYLIRLGVAVSAEDEESDKAFAALIRDFPQEPSAYAFAMNEHGYRSVHAPNRVEQWGVTPEEAAKVAGEMTELPWHKGEENRKRDLNQIHRVLALLETASRVDPGNGLFKQRKAICLFGLHRDEEALASIHEAALAPRFDHYDQMRAKALDRLWDARGGFDPIGRSNGKNSIDSYYSKDRDVARIVEHLAYMRIKRGEIDGGVSLAMDQMCVGYRQAAVSREMMDALVGIALCKIAAAALDPMADMSSVKDRATRGKLSDPDARLKREVAFLTSHGYDADASLLKKCMSDCDRWSAELRRQAAQDSGSFISVAAWLIQAFRTGTRMLAICALALLLWFVTGIFTLRRSFGGMWDKRAAVSASLIAVLPLAVFLELFAEGISDPTRGMSTIFGAFMDALSGGNDISRMLGISFGRVAVPLHWLLIAVALCCLFIGLLVAARRTPQPGERRSVSAVALIIAYMAVFGLLVEMAYNSRLSSLDLTGGVNWEYLIRPLVLLAAYSLFRSVTCRFSHVPESGLMTFLATMRHGSVLVAAILAVGFAVLVPITAITAHRLDSMAQVQGRQDVPVVGSRR